MATKKVNNWIVITGVIAFLAALFGTLADGFNILDRVSNKEKNAEITVNDGDYVNGDKVNGDKVIGNKIINMPEPKNYPDTTMEFIELIDALLIPMDAGYNIEAWSKGTNSPISWQHTGIIMRSIDNTYCECEQKYSFCRIGSVYITLNGKFTHTVLGKDKEPVKWHIHLCGYNGNGYSKITLTNNVCTHEFSGFYDYFQEHKMVDKVEEFNGEEGAADQYYRYELSYQLNYKNRKVYLLEQDYMGGNCGTTVMISFSSTGAKEEINEYQQLGGN